MSAMNRHYTDQDRIDEQTMRIEASLLKSSSKLCSSSCLSVITRAACSYLPPLSDRCAILCTEPECRRLRVHSVPSAETLRETGTGAASHSCGKGLCIAVPSWLRPANLLKQHDCLRCFLQHLDHPDEYQNYSRPPPPAQVTTLQTPAVHGPQVGN